MNSNTSTESHTTSMEQPLRPLNSTRVSQEQTVLQSEPTMRPTIQLPITPTGENESNQTLMPSVPLSLSKSEISSASQSSSLKSLVKPHVLLEKLPLEPRVLKVSEADIKALCQVISEFQEQFSCTF